MEAEIRALFIKYGITEVKECVEKECRHLYESLQSIYEVKRKYERKVKVKAEAEAEEAPVAPVEEPPNPPPKSPVVKKIRKIKPIIEDEKEENTENIFQNIKKSNVIFVAAPVEEPESEPEFEPEPALYQKQVHQTIVAEKRKELMEQGIEPESLLTKENLEKWLKSRKTYMRIAKETGVDEGEVSRIAKGFGLSSVMSKYKFLRIPKRS
jgi:hypothetical protein